LAEIDKLILDLPKSSLKEFKIEPEYYATNKRVVDLNFPQSAFIVMIERNGVYLRPGGSTVIEANDLLMVLADDAKDFDLVKECLISDTSD
jgi:cell volume regulation protein A